MIRNNRHQAVNKGVATRRTASWLERTLRGVLALLLVASLVQAARQAVDNAHAVWNSREAIRRADHWDPWNPEFPEQFGRALAGAEPGADPQEVASAFEDTIRLGRRRPDYWANLGDSLDLAGKTPEAMRAYERALELFPRSPAINWQFAKFLVRSGDATKATEPLRLVIAGNPSLWTGAFDLAWRAGMPREQILEIIPARQEVLSASPSRSRGSSEVPPWSATVRFTF